MSYAQEEQQNSSSNHSPIHQIATKRSNGNTNDMTPGIPAKVKVYYTWKGSETTCLCTFPWQIESTEASLIKIPLRRCVLSVCSSCPDMLLRPESDSAIYTANFEEFDRKVTNVADEGIVWEGHGLMSWILNDANQTETYVLGRLANPSNEQNAYTVEVLLQLHPTHRITKTDFYHSLTRARTNQNEQAITLPRPQQPWPASSGAYDGPYRPDPTSEPPSTSQMPAPQQTAHFSPRPMNIARLPNSSSAPAISSSQETEFDSFISRRRLGGNRFATPIRKTSEEVHGEGPMTRLPPIRPIPMREDMSASPGRSYYHDERPMDHDYNNGDPAKRRRLSPPPANNTHATKGGAFKPINPARQVSPAVHSPSLELSRSQSDSPEGNTPHLLPANGRQMPRFRRKKRDTKPPNNDIRSVVDIAKDGSGQYILPVEVDSWTVYDLGKVVWDRPAFHNQRYIYPVGYRVKKWYRSMVDPLNDTQYTCEILDGGKEPIFRLQADDNMDEVFTGPTCTTVWTIAVRRAFAVRNMEYGHNPVGPDFFGLRKNTIAKMIQDLPHAEKCKNYIWQNFEVGKTNKTVRSFLPENESSPHSGPERSATVKNESEERQ
ncbi:hypothetical protein VKS41_009001 [Umbelopsis sp. WA50703]